MIVAVAHPNVALAKYWGKRDVPGNVPATPSVSVVLGGLETRTRVELDPALDRDVLLLNGEQAPIDRVARLLDELRDRSAPRARITSTNDFPTSSGLASSASGFAALARAAVVAYRSSLDVGRLARRASASAARSVLGGFVALGTEDDAAPEQVAREDHWPLSIVVAAVTLGAKPTSSTSGMEHCRATSPYYAAWVDDAPKLAREVREAIVARDLERLGEAAEASAFRMHACMMASAPALLYWTSGTLEVLAHVRALRKKGVAAFVTIDAGPHVKILCAPSDAARVAEGLPAVRTIVAHVGGPARIVEGS